MQQSTRVLIAPNVLLGTYFFIGLLPFSEAVVPQIGHKSIIIAAGLLFCLTINFREPNKKPDLHLVLAASALVVSFLLASINSSSPTLSWGLLEQTLPGALLAVAATSRDNVRPLLITLSLVIFSSLIVNTIFCAIEVASLKRLLDAAAFVKLQILFLKVPNDILLYVVTWPLTAWVVEGQQQCSAATKRIALFTYLVMTLVLSVLVDSRSAFLLVVCCYFCWLITGPLVNRRLWMFVPAICLPALVIFIAPKFFDEILNLPSSSQRLWIWAVSLEMVPPSHHLLGLGHGMFDTAFEMARNYVEVPASLKEDPRRMSWAHNIFVEAWVERGYFGLAVQLYLIFALAQKIYSGKHSYPYRSALLGFLSLLLATSLFELTYLRSWVCLAYGLIIGLAISFGPVYPAKSRTETHL